jgi:hypothetical protein
VLFGRVPRFLPFDSLRRATCSPAKDFPFLPVLRLFGPVRLSLTDSCFAQETVSGGSFLAGFGCLRVRDFSFPLSAGAHAHRDFVSASIFCPRDRSGLPALSDLGPIFWFCLQAPGTAFSHEIAVAYFLLSISNLLLPREQSACSV